MNEHTVPLQLHTITKIEKKRVLPREKFVVVIVDNNSGNDEVVQYVRSSIVRTVLYCTVPLMGRAAPTYASKTF